MDRGDMRQAAIVCVQRGRYIRETMHDAIYMKFDRIGASEQSLDLAPIADNKLFVASLNEWRASKEHSVGRNGQA